MSDETAGKAEWLARIERGRAAWEALVAGVDEDAMERPGVDGDWSFKDVTAHLNAWRAWTVARLDAAAGDGAAPSPPWPEGMGEETPEGVDEINQWFYARGRDRPAAEILAEAREQFQRIRVAVEAMPEATLSTRFPWLEGYPVSAVIDGALDHLHEDHEPGIRAWLARQTG